MEHSNFHVIFVIVWFQIVLLINYLRLECGARISQILKPESVPSFGIVTGSITPIQSDLHIVLHSVVDNGRNGLSVVHVGVNVPTVTTIAEGDIVLLHCAIIGIDRELIAT